MMSLPTLSFQNTGTVPAMNITVIDSIPAGTVFIPDSVTINGFLKQEQIHHQEFHLEL